MSPSELSVPGEPSASLAACLSGEALLDEFSQLPGEVGAVFVLHRRGGSSTWSCAFGHSETQEALGFIFLKTVQSFLDLICRESPGLRERKER